MTSDNPTEMPTVRLLSCLGVMLDLKMLPHFLRHYADLGIAPERMHFILHAEQDDTPGLIEAETLLTKFGAAPPTRWIGVYTSDDMWAQRRALQQAVAAPDDWIVNADIDEHYVFPAAIDEVVAHCREIGVNCVQGLQIDRFARDGAPVPVADQPSLAEQFPVEGEATFHIFGKGRHRGISSTTKLMLHGADILPRRGGHNPEGLTPDSRESASEDGPCFLAGRPLHTFKNIADPAFRFAFPFQSAHYKWTANRLPAIEKRLSAGGVSPAGREFGQKVRAYIEQHGGIQFEDVALRGANDRPEPHWREMLANLRKETPKKVRSNAVYDWLKARFAARPGASATHAVPIFQGRDSRSHHRVPISDLRKMAQSELKWGAIGEQVETFVQFAGFPRSGHSIVGSILDAHPDMLIAHELNVMELIHADVPMNEIFAMIRANSREFEAAGRYWNGFCYAVPGGQGGQSDRPRVMGDKKADGAVRQLKADPTTLDDLRTGLSARRCAWISVIRNPWDNVATLSLRTGRRYDALRIEAADETAFAERLKSEQGGSIAAEALPEMVSDYAELCAGIAALKARVSPGDWLELRQDDLIANPASSIMRILDFLNLPDSDGFSDRAAEIISQVPSRTRDRVKWPTDLRREMGSLCEKHAFLHGFEGL